MYCSNDEHNKADKAREIERERELVANTAEHHMNCAGHSHDHEHGDEAALASLREYVDVPRVYCLNEATPNSGRAVLKSYEDRFTETPHLLSADDPDDEPELLLHVPFTEAVAIKTLSVQGAPGRSNGGRGDIDTSAPQTVKVFVNRTDLDFETACDMEPTTTVTLLPPEHGAGYGTIDYPLRPAGRFQSASSITLYFGDNYAREADPDGDAVQTEISYVGFKGKGTNVKRRAVEAVYESRAMKEDHKVPDGEFGMQNPIG